MNTVELISNTVSTREESFVSEGLLSCLDALSDYCILFVDCHGVIKSANAAALALLGPESLTGHFLSSILPVDLTLYEAEQHLWAFPIGGDQHWVSVKHRSWCSDDGVIRGHGVFIREVAGGSNSEVNQDEDASLRIRDEFTSLASHELRTPVTKLLLNLQFVKRTYEGISERTRKSLDICEQSTKELIALMDNLVDVSRLRLGKLEIRRTKTNVTNIVMNVLNKNKDMIRLGGHHVSFLHDGPILGYWDQTRLDQLFSNLLSNALKYSEGSPIRIELSNLGDRMRFTISDEGPGIPRHLQAMIFERFERAADSRKISGLGLGLYVSRQIVTAHQGEMTLESEPGRGACFSVLLPLKKN